MSIANIGRSRFQLQVKFGVLVLLFAALPGIARASLIFTNFGASLAYNINSGNEVGDDGIGDTFAQADTFTPSSNYTLTDVVIALSCLSSCPNSFSVDLVTDSLGLPNTSNVLATFNVLGTALGSFGTNNMPLTLTPGASVSLTAGTPYWVVVLPATGDQVVWNWNSTGDTSNEAIAYFGGGPSDTWYTLGATPGAYQVDGTVATPEPGTVGMLLCAALGILPVLRKRLFAK